MEQSPRLQLLPHEDSTIETEPAPRKGPPPSIRDALIDVSYGQRPPKSELEEAGCHIQRFRVDRQSGHLIFWFLTARRPRASCQHCQRGVCIQRVERSKAWGGDVRVWHGCADELN